MVFDHVITLRVTKELAYKWTAEAANCGLTLSEYIRYFMEHDFNMTDPEPNDPFAGMAVSAIAQFEMFRAYIEAGFSERQAILLVAELAAVAFRESERPS